MSILEKSEKIGQELRNTKEGQRAYELRKIILHYPQETTSTFFQLINHDYVQMHFFAVQHALDILKVNLDNEILKPLINRILSINELNDFAKANIPIGNFVEKISKFAFNNKVKYELPNDISFTPELVRLANSLTVECLRTNIFQQFLAEYHTKPDFDDAIKRFDDLKAAKPVVPYSKDDRKTLGILKKEFGEKCDIEILYSLVSIMTYIKSMIFDSFYDCVFEIHEDTDILSRKQKKLNNCIYNRLSLRPDAIDFISKYGWIIKIYNSDGTVSYGQIFKKTSKWTNDKCEVIVCALLYDIL